MKTLKEYLKEGIETEYEDRKLGKVCTLNKVEYVELRLSYFLHEELDAIQKYAQDFLAEYVQLHKDLKPPII